MLVEGREVELASDEEDDRANGLEATVAAGLALGGLEQPVEGFQEAVGLPGLRPPLTRSAAKLTHSNFKRGSFSRVKEKTGNYRITAQ